MEGEELLPGTKTITVVFEVTESVSTEQFVEWLNQSIYEGSAEAGEALEAHTVNVEALE